MTPTLLETLYENNLCLSTNPNGTDKEFPKKYISEVYENLIGSRSEDALVFLEIGVRTGASVRLWSEYFSKSTFIGIDNGKDVIWQNEEWLKAKNIQYLQADAYLRSTVKDLPEYLDVIVDDGPHSLESQIWAIQNYSKALAPNGFLFIEDIQGGRRYCNQIVRSTPADFSGCIRIFDLRKKSGQGDAIVICIHNCDSSCNLNVAVSNQLNLKNTLLRYFRYEEQKYSLSRLLKKIQFKLKSIKLSIE